MAATGCATANGAMAKYFLHVKVFSRGQGSRVTRAAAYRAGERIRDERTSEVYNYSDRQDVLHKEIGQVSGTYGSSVADTIVENCGNTLILRCSGSERGETFEFASKLIGQQQVVHTTRSRTRRSTDWLASITTSAHLSIEPAVMASEIERLPDLQGFLKFAWIPDWRRVRLTPVTYPTVARSKPGRLAGGPAASAGAEH